MRHVVAKPHGRIDFARERARPEEAPGGQDEDVKAIDGRRSTASTNGYGNCRARKDIARQSSRRSPESCSDSSGRSVARVEQLDAAA